MTTVIRTAGVSATPIVSICKGGSWTTHIVNFQQKNKIKITIIKFTAQHNVYIIKFTAQHIYNQIWPHHSTNIHHQIYKFKFHHQIYKFKSSKSIKSITSTSPSKVTVPQVHHTFTSPSNCNQRPRDSLFHSRRRWYIGFLPKSDTKSWYSPLK
jgi:hypothetical protein